VRNTTFVKSAELLRVIYKSAYVEFLAAPHSQLARRILDFAADELGYKVGVMDLSYMNALPPLAAVVCSEEMDSMFYRRVAGALGIEQVDDLMSHEEEKTSQIAKLVQ
jgi:hypothetical protein